MHTVMKMTRLCMFEILLNACYLEMNVHQYIKSGLLMKILDFTLPTVNYFVQYYMHFHATYMNDHLYEDYECVFKKFNLSIPLSKLSAMLADC